ncbi:hypothetical protein M0804_006379 [Polistes exclamans]|nr:hypothetical protein M0804_006379 [Polistes exclamans]
MQVDSRGRNLFDSYVGFLLYNRGFKRTAFEIGSARYFLAVRSALKGGGSKRAKGGGSGDGGGGGGEREGGEYSEGMQEAPSSQLQFVFALKRNITC